MKVLKSKQVRKFMDSQDAVTRGRLEAALNNLPYGDVVSVVNAPDTYRLRVGKFRAVFVREGELIKVTLLDVRGKVYKRSGL